MIIPIFKKKGERSDPNNYRGITLVSVMGKLFTKLLNSRIESFLDLNRILLDNQAGFRKNRSTTDQVFVIQSLVDIFLKRGKKLYIAWVDYAKAFDKVWRQGLFYKMLKQGLSAKIVNIVKSIYANIKSKVMVNGVLSNAFASYSGVRQGESLSPMLFAIAAGPALR